MTFNLTLQPWIHALLAAGVLWAASALILRSSQIRGLRFRVIILCLRLAVLLALFIILADPVVRRGMGSSDSPVHALVLVDCSESMAFGPPGATRFDTVRACLAKGGESVRRHARILTFDAGVSGESIPVSALPDTPQGRTTHLAGALRRAADATLQTGSGNLVVFSDGRTHDKAGLPDSVDRLRARGIKVSAIPVGQAPDAANGAIVNCAVERQAPAASRLPVRILLAFQGTRGQTATLLVQNTRGDILDQTEFVPWSELTERTLQISVGTEDDTFTVILEPLQGETRRDDNRMRFTVNVKTPTIRALYMEGSNHKDKRWKEKWEYEFIGEALRETEHIDVDVMTVDEQVAEGGRLYYVDDPGRGFPETREEVFTYDIVICSDINRTIFTPEQLGWVVDLVAERGGGFCMIGGYTAFGAGKWDKTVWEQMIPVDMQTAEDGYKWEEIKPLIPEAVHRHPIWTIDSDPEANARILQAHPAFLGMNLVNRAKPAATVLALWEEKDMPVICVQPYGRGRSMAFMPDAAGGWGELYQTEWGEGEKDNRHYRRFWVNTVRWLAENSLSSRNTPWIVTTDAVNYRPGETVQVTARRQKVDKPEALESWNVTAEVQEAEGRPIRLALQEEGRFSGTLQLPESLDAADAVIRVVAKSRKNNIEQEDVPIRIVNASLETLDPSPDRKLLEDLAALTGGKIYEPDSTAWLECLRPPERNTEAGVRQFSIPLWDRSWIWGILVILISAEWYLRKRLRLRG